MDYREYAPAPALCSWVQCYWTRGSCTVTSPLRVLPDGCADLIFEIGDARGYAVGTMTRALTIDAPVLPAMFGIRFRPGRAGILFGLPLGVLTDLRTDLTDVARGTYRFLAERLSAVGTDAGRIALIDGELMAAVARADVERRVDEAVRLIIGAKGLVDIDDVAHRADCSRQHLARLFGMHVGLTPKTFARVTRFRHALDIARRAEGWADVAAAAGYYDQSHLIADFRGFAGITPVPFLLSAQARRA